MEDIIKTIEEEQENIAKEIKRLLGITNTRLELKNIDFMDYKTTQKFDIVSCMGMIHYFDVDNYEKVFDKLVGLTKDLLILELRVTHGTGLIEKRRYWQLTNGCIQKLKNQG